MMDIKIIKNFFNNYICEILLILFTIFLITTNYLWLKIDTVSPWWDQAWYLLYSHIFFDTLIHHGVGDFLFEFSEAFGFKSPLISALPIPFYFIFGKSHDIALYTNITLIIVFNIFTYKLIYLLKHNKKIALLTVLISGTMPLIFGISRQFLVEYPVMVFVIIWHYLLLKSNFFTKQKYNFLLGIIGGLGMLLKVLFPIYIILPTLIILKKRIKEKKEKVILDLTLICLLIFSISSIWYIKNFSTLFEFLKSNSFGKISNDYSLGPVFSFETISKFFFLTINTGISSYYFSLLILFSSIFVIYKLIGKNERIQNPNSYFFLLLWLTLPILIFFFGNNKEVRYLLPIFPAIAALISFLFFDLFKKQSHKIYLLLIIFPIYNLFYSSFDFLPKNNFKISSFILSQRIMPFTFPPKKDYWPIPEIIQYINSDHENESNFFSQTILLISLIHFNHDNFSYYNSFNKNKMIYAGTPQDKIEDTHKRLLEMKYIITKEGGDQGALFINKFNPIFKEQLKKGDLPYYKIKEFDLPDKSKAFIYKKNTDYMCKI